MIYFDNSATTYPKPQSVIQATAMTLETCTNPGRGAHPLSMNAALELYECRKAAAEMFGASPERVIFTPGATYALNMAIHAVSSVEGAILISDLEHNAVLRPALASGREVRVFSSAPFFEGEERTAAILASAGRLSEDAALLVATAASNICGAVMPISELGAFCRERGILFIVDGAQAGGIYDINVERDNIDVLCLPSHKGLYGPMGCGMMILGEGVTLPTFVHGGSGVDSRAYTMPVYPPERYEAGTLPVPVIAGLRRGIEFVKKRTANRICAIEARLARLLSDSLINMGARVYAPHLDGGIVLFNMDGFSSEELAARLAKMGICVRAGLHCAPLAHDTIGSDGAVRASFSVWNTEAEVHEFCGALCKIKRRQT